MYVFVFYLEGMILFIVEQSDCNTLAPLHLFLVLFLSGLSLHLLHFDGVRLPPPHVQLVVSHAQRQDALVDPQPWSIEHKVLRGVKIMNL